MLVAAWIAVFLFPLVEITLALSRRSDPATGSVEDRGSMRLLWSVIVAGVLAALLLRGVAATRMHLPLPWRLALVVGLIGVGLAVRAVAIVTLGRLFTVDVAVQEGHALVERGLYRYVRHPSYTGLLLAFTGLGIFFGNWLGLGILLAAVTLGLVRRMNVEEAALGRALGVPYAEYCARTKRLVPGLY